MILKLIAAVALLSWLALLAAGIAAYQRAVGRLDRWTAAHRLRLIRRRFWAWPAGPMAEAVKRAEPVFRIEVLDEDGIAKTGWVRCGRGVGGFGGDDVDVEWTD